MNKGRKIRFLFLFNAYPEMAGKGKFDCDAAPLVERIKDFCKPNQKLCTVLFNHTANCNKAEIKACMLEVFSTITHTIYKTNHKYHLDNRNGSCFFYTYHHYWSIKNQLRRKL